MRTHSIFCDWCGVTITDTLIVYSHKFLLPHATFEGARDTWDFCCDEHLVAWKDEAAIRRLAQERTGRVVRADEESGAAYRLLLEDALDGRIAEALSGPRRPQT